MIYLITFAISIALFYLSSRYKGVVKAFFLLLGVLLPAMLAGLRTVNIGTDTGGYPLDVFFTVRVLNSLPAALDWIAGDVEDLYVAIAYFCSHLIDSFNFFLFVISLITIGLLIGGGVCRKRILLGLPYFGS